MAITYPLSWPSALYVSGITISSRNAISVTESPFNFEDDTTDWGGEQWLVEGRLPVMERATAEVYICFMLALKGRRGSFLFPVPETTPLGVATGTPLVKGASQTGNELITDGWTNSTTNILKKGTWINLGSGSSTRLHKVIEDANSDGTGTATLTIWPSLRTSPADNAPLTISNCVLLARLAGDVPFEINTDKHYFLTFSASEVL